MLFLEKSFSKRCRSMVENLVPAIVRRRNTVFRALLWTLAVPFGVQSILFISYYALLNRSEQREQSQYISKEIIGRTNWLFASVGMLTTNALLFVFTKDLRCKNDFDLGKPGLEQNV